MRLNLNPARVRPAGTHTRQRELILDRIQTLPGHFSAEELVFSLARGGQRVSRATVYRTLDLLVASGVLQRVSLDERGSRYEVIRQRPPHAHLYCLGCGRLEDYRLPSLRHLPRRVHERAQFATEHLLVRICGYCKKCQSRKTRSKCEETTQLRLRRRAWEK